MRRAILVLCCAAALICAEPANAGVASVRDGVLTYIADPGTADSVAITYYVTGLFPNSDGYYVAGPGARAGDGCFPIAPSNPTPRCRGPVSRVVLDLGDGDDSFQLPGGHGGSAQGGTQTAPIPVPVDVRTGDGNDSAGISGAAGGPLSTDGPLTIDGGSGDDQFGPDITAPSIIRGGDGNDRLGNELPPAGPAPATARSQPAELDGGAGDDTIQVGDDDGKVRDNLNGGEGSDWILLAPGQTGRDDTISCGAGFDAVAVRAADGSSKGWRVVTPNADCEPKPTVAAATPVPRPASRLLSRGLKISLACQRRCDVRVALRDKAGRLLRPESGVRLAAGGQRIVTLKLSKARWQSLLRGGRATLNLTTNFSVQGRWTGTWLVQLEVRRQGTRITAKARTVHSGLATSPAGPGSGPE